MRAYEKKMKAAGKNIDAMVLDRAFVGGSGRSDRPPGEGHGLCPHTTDEKPGRRRGGGRAGEKGKRKAR